MIQQPSLISCRFIVFDEIEFCPAARAAIKYLVEDGRYDYLETGSLLGMKMSTKKKLKKNEKKEDYLVPSEEESMVMHPMPHLQEGHHQPPQHFSHRGKILYQVHHYIPGEMRQEVLHTPGTGLYRSHR